MEGPGVVDRFLGVFTAYIDSGFGLLGGEGGGSENQKGQRQGRQGLHRGLSGMKTQLR